MIHFFCFCHLFHPWKIAAAAICSLFGEVFKAFQHCRPVINFIIIIHSFMFVLGRHVSFFGRAQAFLRLFPEVSISDRIHQISHLPYDDLGQVH